MDSLDLEEIGFEVEDEDILMLLMAGWYEFLVA